MRADHPDYSNTEFQPTDENPGYQPRQLVLVGAGHTHLQVLAQWAKQPIVNARITLIAPQPYQLHPRMVPGLIAGHYSLEECSIALEPLVRRSGIRWLTRSLRGLNAKTQKIQLDDGSSVAYDWLSIDSGPVQSRSLLDQRIPGAREHGLFVRPAEVFSELWAQVTAMGDTRALRFAVIGAGAAGIELSMAVRQRLPNAAITLLTGPQPLGVNQSAAVQKMLQQALKNRRITVIQDAVANIRSHEVTLSSGARLACDVPLISTGMHPAPWLQSSGLQLDAQGFMAVDAWQRSTNYPNVFAARDISSQENLPLARTGVYTSNTGNTLAHNLAASVGAGELKAYPQTPAPLSIIACGNRYAIATWRHYSAQGHWLWWLKNWLDHRWIARYRRP